MASGLLLLIIGVWILARTLYPPFRNAPGQVAGLAHTIIGAL
jgi:hypothetical protein